MRTGRVEANLVKLNEEFRLPAVPELVARKVTESEGVFLDDADLVGHEVEYHRLRAALEEAAQRSSLPEAPQCRAALNELLVRLRLASR